MTTSPTLLHPIQRRHTLHMETAFELDNAPSSEHPILPTGVMVNELRESLATENWATAVSLVGAHWSVLIDDFGGLIDEALRAIPLPYFAQDTRAAAIRDIRLHTDADDVDRMLGEALIPEHDDLEAIEDIARSPQALSLLSVVAVRMIALRVRGLVARAVQLAKLLERLGHIAIVHQPGLISPRLPSALLHAGITRGLGDDIPGAMLALREAYERAPADRAGYVERDAAGKAAFFAALAGDMAEAVIWIQRYDRAPKVYGWLKPRIALTADIARSLVATEGLKRADAEAALAEVDQPVNAEQSWGPGVTYARARYALAWGDALGAIEMIRRDRHRYAHWLTDDSTLHPLLTLAESDLLLSLGRVHPAHDLLSTHADHPLIRVARARAELAAGDHAAAARYAAVALNDRHSTRSRVEALAVQTATKLRARPQVAAVPPSSLVEVAKASGLMLSTRIVPEAGPLDPTHHSLDAVREPLPTLPDNPKLTERQILVLRGMQQGLTLRQIGARQHLSVNTMKTHATALYRRLGVTTRDEAIARAHELGLL